MAHENEIYDNDLRFLVNPTTRVVAPKTQFGKSLIKFDHNSERITFEVPRYVEDHDMSSCNRVEVHYANIDKETLARNEGVYAADDLKVDAENENAVTFSWLISQNATQLVGPLEFSLSYTCVDGDQVNYVWGTKKCTVLEISERQDSSNAVVLQYADVLQSWWKKLFVIEGGTVDENSDEALTFWLGSRAEYDALPEEEKNVENRLYFYEDDPSTKDLMERIGALQGDVDTALEELEKLQTEDPDTPSHLMLKSIYDKDGDGVVDSAASLGGTITVDNVATREYVAQQVGTPLQNLLASLGSSNGIASLDEKGVIPVAQLPVAELKSTFVPIAGGQMTGKLKLLDEDPTEETEAVPKHYVDRMLGVLQLIDEKTYTAESPGSNSEFSCEDLTEFYLSMSCDITDTGNDFSLIKLFSGSTQMCSYRTYMSNTVYHGKKIGDFWRIEHYEKDSSAGKVPSILHVEKNLPINTITIQDNCEEGKRNVTIKLYGVLA